MPVVTFDIHIDDLSTVLALFDHVQVWRSPDQLGSPTPYAEITASANLPAQIDGSVQGPWTISGSTLTLTLNSADPVTVTFTGADDLILVNVLAQINAVVPGLATEVPTGTGRVRLTSSMLGTGSNIQVGGSAATVLGFSTTKVNGKQARIPIIDPTTEYTFKDYDGNSTFWYKTRYYSSQTGAVSSFSAPRQGSAETVIATNLLSTALVNLSDVSGHPIVKRRVIFVPVKDFVIPTTSYVLFPGVDRLEVLTDENGSASIALVRGATVKVFFEGSNYNREFVVPNTTEFDLMTVLSTTPDPMSIVQAPPSPIRVS